MLCSLLLLASCQGSPQSLGPAANTRPLPTEVVDVFVLTGQSNSLGTTNFEGSSPATHGPGADPSDALIEFFWSNVRAGNTNYPPMLYGDSGGSAGKLQMQQGDGAANPAFWGLEHGFARTLQEHQPARRSLHVIKVSRGGGGNTYWHRPSFELDSDAGHMWGHLRDEVDRALADLTLAGRIFRVRGLLYMQGEGNNSTEASAAAARLSELHGSLQAHIEAHYPGTAVGMRLLLAEIAASTSTTSRELTTQQQMELAAGASPITFVRTADLPLKADGIHFGREAKLEIGQRLAETLLGTSRPFQISSYDASNGAPLGAGEVQSPVDFGFQELGAGAGVSLEGMLDGGTPCWRILDDSPLANPGYQRSLSGLDFLGMFHSGWSFRTTFKVTSGGGLALWSVTSDRDPGWGVAGGAGNMNGFVVDVVGASELRAALWGSPVPAIVLGPGSAEVFHTLELRGLGGSSLCDFYLDGALVACDIDLTASPGLAGFGDRVLFNSGQTSGVGREVHWADLSLTSIQHPFPGN